MHVVVVGAGLQYGLPGTWNGMRERGMKPEDVTRLWSTHAAKLAGMQHRKGSLAPGMDADIVVGVSAHPFSAMRYVVASMPAPYCRLTCALQPAHHVWSMAGSSAAWELRLDVDNKTYPER